MLQSIPILFSFICTYSLILPFKMCIKPHAQMHLVRQVFSFLDFFSLATQYLNIGNMFDVLYS